MSISSLWPATAIKAFVTDKLGAPPSVLRTPDVFADAVLGIAEEKSDKWVLAILFLRFFFWLKVVNRKTERLLGKTTFVIVYCVFRQSIFWCSKHVKIPLFFQVKWLGSYRWGLSENHRHIGLLQIPLWPGCGATQNDAT